MDIPWYRKYDLLKSEIVDLRERFHERCHSLRVDPEQILGGFLRSLIARIVQESNWQEGLQLSLGRTQELTDLAFDDLRLDGGARLDLAGILDAHRAQVLRLKRRATVEELAALNLSRAHILLRWIAHELATRQTASLVSALSKARDLIFKVPAEALDEHPIPSQLESGFLIIDRLLGSQAPAFAPLGAAIGTEGELLGKLLSEDFDSLVRPFHLDYLHALHRTSMMGILPSKKLGTWRNTNVHVGSPDVVLPPPDAVPALMREFATDFPAILPQTVKYDPLLVAAQVSHRFVRIHPYVDGNGRISRLLINLVLWGHHPPVSMASRAKGRHRYRQALRRADRGSMEPLACLIAISIKDSYEAMIRALDP